jgi:hypothetical protein
MDKKSWSDGVLEDWNMPEREDTGFNRGSFIKTVCTIQHPKAKSFLAIYTMFL